MNAPEPRSSATVILLRDRSSLEVLLVRRHGGAGFMAGAYVFPGGVVDADDGVGALDGVGLEEARRLLAEPNLEAPLAVGIFRAAVRETAEEVGIELRAIDLVPFARWITPEGERRRYDARFFLATTSAEGRIDEREITDMRWLSPVAALHTADRGEIVLPPPTRRSLEQLAVFQTSAAAIESARKTAPPLVRPVLRPANEDDFELILPGHPDHTEKVQVIPGDTRILVPGGRKLLGPPKGP